MQQVWIRKFGGAKTLSYEEAPDPKVEELKDNEVMIDAHYSGINFADVMMRLGFYQDAPPRPFVPGYEVSGIVIGKGKNVDRVQIGDRVCSGVRFGGYASKVVVPDYYVIPLPKGYDFKMGAALPVAFLTAYAALFKMGGVKKGDRVLVDCATGGVGTLALQMLKGAGAEVVGLTGTESKKGIISDFGAKPLTHAEFANNPKENRFDVILNSLGGKSVLEHMDRLGPTGKIIGIGVASGMDEGKRNFIKLIRAALAMPKFSLLKLFEKNKGVFGLNALLLFDDEIYLENAMKDFSKVEEWNLKPYVGDIFDAKDVQIAHRKIETRQARGKILLRWKDEQ